MKPSLEQHALDILIRAAKTFVQAAVPLWAASNFSYSKGALYAVAAAGISAVWNLAIKLEVAWANGQPLVSGTPASVSNGSSQMVSRPVQLTVSGQPGIVVSPSNPGSSSTGSEAPPDSAGQ